MMTLILQRANEAVPGLFTTVVGSQEDLHDLMLLCEKHSLHLKDLAGEREIAGYSFF